MNFRAVVFDDAFRVLGTRRFDDEIALCDENRAGQLAHLRIIFHQQNRLGAPTTCGWHLARRQSISGLVNPWQINFERRSLPRLAIDPYISAALLHDTV